MEIMDNEKLIAEMIERVRLAELKMAEQFSKDLYSMPPDFFFNFEPPTPEQIKASKRRELIRKLKAPYYWLKWRIQGTWNIWTKGECGECEREEDY